MEDEEIYLETQLRKLEFEFNQINRALWGLILGTIIYLQGFLVYPNLFDNNPVKIYAATAVGFMTIAYSVVSGVRGVLKTNNNIAEEIESEEYREKLKTGKEKQKIRNMLSLPW